MLPSEDVYMSIDFCTNTHTQPCGLQVLYFSDVLIASCDFSRTKRNDVCEEWRSFPQYFDASLRCRVV